MAWFFELRTPDKAVLSAKTVLLPETQRRLLPGANPLALVVSI